MNSESKNEQTVKILWFSLLFSILVFISLTQFTDLIKKSENLNIQYIDQIIASISLVLAFISRMFFIRYKKSKVEANAIISFAISEGIGALGIISKICGSVESTTISIFMLSLIIHIVHYPKE